MFTGLIETTGSVRSIRKQNDSLRIGIIPQADNFAVTIGSSVSVNGVCLTVESVVQQELYFTAVQETIAKTTLPRLQVGTVVNLERALMVGSRLDGHIVQGHVDGIGTIISDQKQGNSIVRSITVPGVLYKFMAYKGSVAVDGISLTIAESSEERISVALIPFTIAYTTMENKRVGDQVNIECDVFARYIYQLLIGTGKTGTLSKDQNPSVASSGNGSNLLTILENAGF